MSWARLVAGGLMKKSMFATLSLVCMFAIAGGNGTPPAAAAAPTEPEVGTCRWFCGPFTKSFASGPACEAACPTTWSCESCSRCDGARWNTINLLTLFTG